MSRKITFVTESHAFGDEKSSAEILDRGDVRAIASELAKDAEQGAIETTKRELDRHGRRVQDLERSLEELRKGVETAQSCAEQSQRNVDKLVENVHGAFSSSIEEILRPQYESLASILEAAIAPTAPENEFHEKLLQSLSNFGEVLHKSTATVDARINGLVNDIVATHTECADNRKSIEAISSLCQTILGEIRNPPKRKGFFWRLFSRYE